LDRPVRQGSHLGAKKREMIMTTVNVLLAIACFVGGEILFAFASLLLYEPKTKRGAAVFTFLCVTGTLMMVAGTLIMQKVVPWLSFVK